MTSRRIHTAPLISPSTLHLCAQTRRRAGTRFRSISGAFRALSGYDVTALTSGVYGIRNIKNYSAGARPGLLACALAGATKTNSRNDEA